MSFRTPLALFFVLLLAGCAAKSELPNRILFPPPPEVGRLEFIGVYNNADDMQTSKAAMFRKSFLGAMGNDSFLFPSGIAVDSHDKVYVSDGMDHNIKVLDFEKQTIHYMLKESSLSRPNGLAFDLEGRLYVADSGLGKVMVFAPDSETILRTIETPEMVRPSYVAVNDRLNRIYVSDAKVQRVFVFDKEGKLLFQFGEGSGQGDDALFGPQGLAIAPDNNVYVPEIFNARISVFDADGKYIRSFGERGDSIWTFDHPKALAFDREGHLYITDSRRGKIVIYTTKGELLMAIGGKVSLGPFEFGFPSALAFNSHDRLYVADAYAKRVSVWQYLSEEYLKERPVTAADIKEIEEFLNRPDTLKARDEAAKAGL